MVISVLMEMGVVSRFEETPHLNLCASVQDGDKKVLLSKEKFCAGHTRPNSLKYKALLSIRYFIIICLYANVSFYFKLYL